MKKTKLNQCPRENKGFIIPFKLKNNSVYLVYVSCDPYNPVHVAYLFTGFVNEQKRDRDVFGSYCSVYEQSYGKPEPAASLYYLEVIKLLHTEENL